MQGSQISQLYAEDLSLTLQVPFEAYEVAVICKERESFNWSSTSVAIMKANLDNLLDVGAVTALSPHVPHCKTGSTN